MDRDDAVVAAENERTREAWDANALFWDERMGDAGNDFVAALEWPSIERLLAPAPGMRLLDVACGNGLISHRLVRLGCTVLATDFSDGMLDRARSRGEGLGEEEATRIEYRRLDATDDAALLQLGDASFDAALCNMGLFDMAAVAPLFRALARVLRPGAPFVFSVLHPCFNNAQMRFYEERSDEGDRVNIERGVKVFGYLTSQTVEAQAIVGQPRPQLLFHRPLEELLGAAFASGFVVDAVEEPGFPPTDDPHPRLGWGAVHEIPPVMVVRARIPTA